MGFDFQIKAELNICTQTGKLYYSSYNTKREETKHYDVFSIVIPHKYLKYIQMRGSHLYPYVDNIQHSENKCSVEDIILEFPSWETVKDKLSDSNKDYWTEKDHNEFKEALHWFHREKVWYVVNYY